MKIKSVLIEVAATSSGLSFISLEMGRPCEPRLIASRDLDFLRISSRSSVMMGVIVFSDVPLMFEMFPRL